MSTNWLASCGANTTSTTPTVVCTGTVSGYTTAIGSGVTQPTDTTATCTGATTGMNLLVDYTTDLTGVTGWTSSTNGILTIFKFITSNTVHIKYENNTGGSVTPGAVTFRYTVINP